MSRNPLSDASKRYGDPNAEPRQGDEFFVVLKVRVGYSNGDFRHVFLEDDRGRVWAEGSIPYRALREVRDEPDATIWEQK